MSQLSSLGLEVKSMLGAGSFAQVYHCFDPKHQRQYAVKMIKKESMPQSKIRLFSKQAEILASMDHKNIVKFHSFHESDQCLIIKMELIRGGTLKGVLEQRKRRRVVLSQGEIALFVKSLLQGVKYLHGLNIIHRDLKPGKYLHYKIENILFEDCEDLSTVKIVDFGLSAKLEIHNPVNIKAQCGTLLYMAPEIFNKPSYTKSVDLWSCAVIMFMMFHQGRHPFYYPGMKTDQFKLKLKNQTFPPLSYPLAQNFLQKISKKEYEERYNVNDALKHPWITRNQADEIPLSIHQSFKGFDSTNEIITMLRLFVAVGNVVVHKRAQVDEYYRFKINDFIHSNEAVRVYSPSRRKMKDKNNQLFNKMKQIFNTTQDNQSQNQITTLSATQHLIEEKASPTLKNHQSFYQSLFDRQKSFDLIHSHQKIEVQKLQLNKFHLNHFQGSEKEEILFSLCSKRQTLFEHEYFKNTHERKIKQKIDHQILQSVNMIKSQAQPVSKRQIFQKKSSMKLQKQKVGLKISKKYSVGAGEQKIYESSQSRRDYNLSLSSRQISNRRTMSPTKSSNNKPMFISISKNASYTYRK